MTLLSLSLAEKGAPTFVCYSCIFAPRRSAVAFHFLCLRFRSPRTPHPVRATAHCYFKSASVANNRLTVWLNPLDATPRKNTGETSGRLPCAYFLFLACLLPYFFVRLSALDKRARRSSRISADRAGTFWKSVPASTVKGTKTLPALGAMPPVWAGLQALPMASSCTRSC